jgi:purine-binding chemotaxis protein CheW
MQPSQHKNTDAESLDLATFYVRGSAYGIDLLKIQEINKLLILTPVPGAPSYVRGILNLRGQIVTVIDLGYKLGLPETIVDAKGRNIIVRSRGEHIGLLVEQISEVIRVNIDEVEAPPANMNGIEGSFFHGVIKTDDRLIGILDIEKVLD